MHRAGGVRHFGGSAESFFATIGFSAICSRSSLAAVAMSATTAAGAALRIDCSTLAAAESATTGALRSATLGCAARGADSSCRADSGQPSARQ